MGEEVTVEPKWKQAAIDPIYTGEVRINLESNVSPEDSQLIQDDTYKKKSMILSGLDKAKAEATPRRREVFKNAKSFVNWLRGQVGLPDIPEDETQPMVVSNSGMIEVLKRDGALYRPQIGISVVEEDGGSLLEGMRVVHELIHKYIELHVTAAKVSKRGGIRSGLARAGLLVEKTKRRGGELRPTGRLLNELPNYYFSQWWASEELNTHANNWPVEIQARDRNLETLGLKMGQWHEFTNTLPTQRKIRKFRLLTDNLIPANASVDNEKKQLVISAWAVFVELASNLSQLIQEVEGKPLMFALLEAKINPRKQQKIKKAIDSRLGNGFYRKLKQADYPEIDDAIELLVQVQKKIVEEYGN